MEAGAAKSPDRPYSLRNASRSDVLKILRRVRPVTNGGALAKRSLSSMNGRCDVVGESLRDVHLGFLLGVRLVSASERLHQIWLDPKWPE